MNKILLYVRNRISGFDQHEIRCDLVFPSVREAGFLKLTQE